MGSCIMGPYIMGPYIMDPYNIGPLIWGSYHTIIIPFNHSKDVIRHRSKFQPVHYWQDLVMEPVLMYIWWKEDQKKVFQEVHGLLNVLINLERKWNRKLWKEWKLKLKFSEILNIQILSHSGMFLFKLHFNNYEL